MWLRILRVCRQWREVALSCGPFWANIDTNMAGLRAYMLQQSGSALVTLRQVRFEKDKPERNKKLLFEHLHHIRRLGLAFYRCSAEEMTRTISRVFSPVEASALKALEIESDGDEIFVETTSSSSLTSLTLTRAWLSFSPDLILDAITEFSLNDSGLFKDPDTADSFLYTLERMPNLQQLHIVDETTDLVQPSRTTPVSLLHLQTFRLTGFAQIYPYLLRHITLPRTTNYHLTVTEPWGSSSRNAEKVFYQTLANTLKVRVAADTQTYTYHVKFSVTGKETDEGFDPDDPEAKSIRIMVLAIPRASATEEAAVPIPILTVEQQSRQWDWTAGSMYFPVHLSDITNAFPVDAVEEIHVRSNLPLEYNSGYESGTESEEESDDDGSAKPPPRKSKTTNPEGFLACSGVRTLHLEGSPPLEYMMDCGALTAVTNLTGKPESSDHTQHPEGFAVFPKLERLVLEEIGWSLEDSMGLVGIAEKMPPVLKSLSSALAARSAMFDGKYRLKQMEVIGGGPEEWIENIEKKEWISGGVNRSGEESYDWYDGEYVSDSDADGSEAEAD